MRLLVQTVRLRQASRRALTLHGLLPLLLLMVRMMMRMRMLMQRSQRAREVAR